MLASGGPSEVITQVDTAAGDFVNVIVDALPGGRGLLYMAAGPANSNQRIQALDLETGEVKDLTPGQTPRYIPSTGHLLFMDANEGTLLVAPLDTKKLELTGPARPVVEGVLQHVQGWPFFDISASGKLVYRTGIGGGSLLHRPVWVERDGTFREIDPGWRTATADAVNASLALSPDGGRLAISIVDSQGTFDLWVKQLDTGPLSRLTFEGPRNRRATWSPDGESLTFVSNRAGSYDIWTKRADGSGAAALVLDTEQSIVEALYSPDGTWLVFRDGDTNAGSGDIYAIRPGVDSVAVPLVATQFAEFTPAISPDGRWLAYVSRASGRDEIYVRPFPDVGSGMVQVSANGGRMPVWAHSGRELFYIGSDGAGGPLELVAVQVTGDPTFAAGRQDVLFSLADYAGGYHKYAPSPDDQRFVMLRVEETANVELIVVENFFEELKERVPN